MKTVTFIGCSENKSAKGNIYYMLHFADDVSDSKNVLKCSGLKPISCRIDEDEFKDFKDLEFSTEFECSYDLGYDKFGNMKYTLKRYTI